MLLTRPEHSSAELAALLRSAGAEVACVPLIQIAPPPDERALQLDVDAADDAHWVVFTSANGVEAFARRRGAPLDAGTKVAAVGSATAQAVASAFGRAPDLVPPRSDAQALADELVARAHEGARVAIFAASGARPLLQQRLRDAGFTVGVSAAYATCELSPHDIAHHVERAHVIVLTSGSGARALAAGLRHGPGLRALRGRFVACIGPVTAAEARRVGIAVAAVAHEPSATGMLAAIAAAQPTA